jgi:hypothetical protein
MNSIPEIVFTRYLYVKEEVKNALVISILERERETRDKCLFWAYELYYSGFQEELFELIFKIYYDFFASVNPSMERYILIKYGEWKKNDGKKNDGKKNDDVDNDKIPGLIIINLLRRSYTMDVFIMRQIISNFDIDINVAVNIDDDDACAEVNLNINTQLGKNLLISSWILTQDYDSLAKFILIDCPEKSLHLTAIIIANYFKGLLQSNIFDKIENSYKRSLKLYKNARHILLSKLFTCFAVIGQLKMGKNVYYTLNMLDITAYQTKESIGYNLLVQVCKYNINSNKCLSLFALGRNRINLKEAYWYHWEYYASFSPIWKERLTEYRGEPIHETRKIRFENDDYLEEFYEKYGLEPDEQKKETQEKSIQDIVKVTSWKEFYYKYAGLHLIGDIDDYLNEIEIIKY